MQCPKCGAELLDNSKFCGNCGQVITVPEETVTSVDSQKGNLKPEKKVKERKERRYLRLVHLIPIALCLVAICVSFFIPILKFDTDTVNHVADQVAADVEQDIKKVSNAETEEICEIFHQEMDQWKGDNLGHVQKIVQQSLDTTGTNYSMWNLITMPDGIVKRVLTYLEQEKVDISEYRGAWEAETADTISLAQKILIVIGVMAILLLIALILVKVLKRTKFVCLILTTIYSALLMVGSALIIWGLPGIIWSAVPQSDFGAGVEYISLIHKLIGKVIYRSCDQMIMPGVYVLFVASAALLIFSVLSMVTFNKKGKAKKKKVKKSAMAILLVCGVTISSLTGCGSVQDTELNDGERTQLVNMFRYSVNVNREREDYKTLQMVKESLVYAVKKLGIDKSAYRVNSDGLSDSLKQSMEEKMGKTIEEVEQSFKSDVCKGKRIIFMCSHAVLDGGESGAYVAVYLDECKSVYDPSIIYFIDERCKI